MLQRMGNTPGSHTVSAESTLLGTGQGVVNKGRDTLLLQQGANPIPIWCEQHVEVVHVGSWIAHFCQRLQQGMGNGLAVALGYLPAPVCPSLKQGQPHPQQGSLQLIEAAI